MKQPKKAHKKWDKRPQTLRTTSVADQVAVAGVLCEKCLPGHLVRISFAISFDLSRVSDNSPAPGRGDVSVIGQAFAARMPLETALLAKQVKQTIRRVFKERKGQVAHMDDSVLCRFVLFHSNYHMFWICLGSVCHWQVLVGRTLARTNVATVCHWDLVRKTQMARASAFGSTSIVDWLDCFLPMVMKIGSKGAAYNDAASIPTFCSSKSLPLYRRLINFEYCKHVATFFLLSLSRLSRRWAQGAAVWG